MNWECAVTPFFAQDEDSRQPIIPLEPSSPPLALDSLLHQLEHANTPEAKGYETYDSLAWQPSLKFSGPLPMCPPENEQALKLMADYDNQPSVRKYYHTRTEVYEHDIPLHGSETKWFTNNALVYFHALARAVQDIRPNFSPAVPVVGADPIPDTNKLMFPKKPVRARRTASALNRALHPPPAKYTLDALARASHAKPHRVNTIYSPRVVSSSPSLVSPLPLQSTIEGTLSSSPSLWFFTPPKDPEVRCSDIGEPSPYAESVTGSSASSWTDSDYDE